MKVGDTIRHKQPQVYRQLLMMYPPTTEDYREIESLMRHDGYKREHGAIRQTRR